MGSVWTPLLLALKVAGCATLLNLVLGVAAAYGLSRWRSPIRDLINSILTLPPTVLGYYLLVLFGKRGAFGTWFSGLGIDQPARRLTMWTVNWKTPPVYWVRPKPACSFTSACR